jgi:hypothetical protein
MTFVSLLMGGGIPVRILKRVANAPTEREARERAEAAAVNLWRLFGQDWAPNIGMP